MKWSKITKVVDTRFLECEQFYDSDLQKKQWKKACILKYIKACGAPRKLKVTEGRSGCVRDTIHPIRRHWTIKMTKLF